MLKSWLAFLRFPNLLIVGLTQYLIRWCIIEPFAEMTKVTLIFNDFHFFILVITTILITAGGYIINDYYDYPIDKINKPNKLFINTLISEKNALTLYYALNIISLLLTTYLYIAIPLLFIWVFPIALAMLGAMWWYSYRLKRTVLWGNLLVAVFCALVPLSVYLPEIAVMDFYNFTPSIKLIFTQVTYFYMALAFLSTLFREIVKDIEDREGDAKDGCRTLPIVYGVTSAKSVAGAVGFIFLIILAWLFTWQFAFGKLYIILGIALPLLVALYFLQKAHKKADFKQLSLITKYLMVSGILYLVVFYWTYF